jgi:hypothetical protein
MGNDTSRGGNGGEILSTELVDFKDIRDCTDLWKVVHVQMWLKERKFDVSYSQLVSMMAIDGRGIISLGRIWAAFLMNSAHPDILRFSK